MSINKSEWLVEMEWLENVLREVKKQLEEKRNFKDNFKKEAIETQRELWENVGAISVQNGLQQVVDFMQFIDTMKIQKRKHEFERKLVDKYENMISSPYFARMDFKEEGEEKAEKYYIGISNLINEDFDFLIYDWRAPISSMFYDYEIGNAYYKCPEGIINGKISMKRQYKISDGKIDYMFDSNIKIDDEVLQDILSKSSDNKMKAIITTIQKDQNKAIRNEKYKNLIVQGPAGSGKTSVALHRIAYLLYKHRDIITAKNIVIFSPNNIFNDYISNVLPQLGEDNMLQTTFKEYMHKVLEDVDGKEDYCEMMEKIFGDKSEPFYDVRIKSLKFKSSVEFVNLLKVYIEHLEKISRDFEDITLRGKAIISAVEIQELFYKDYKSLPLKRKLEKLRQRILYLIEPYKKRLVDKAVEEAEESGEYLEKDEIVKISKSLVGEEIKAIVNEVEEKTKFDLMDCYKTFYEDLEGFLKMANIKYDNESIREIKRYTLENLRAKKINYEDQIALLFIKGAVGSIPKTEEVKYVIIDEAQDYAPLQYEIFNQLFNKANKTILGDISQSINPYMNIGSYNNVVNILKAEDTSIINLTKSYRSTMEITKFSRKILSEEIHDEYMERSGDWPRLTGLLDEKDINERIVEEVKVHRGYGYNSIGIITKNIDEAQRVYNYLSDRINVKMIVSEDDEYVDDILVIPAYLAKGLEFDVVMIYNASDLRYKDEEDRLLLYTACTRALHVLDIFYLGNVSSLLK
ncbi:phoH-like family protein [Clostridium argentinense CDC 2741]|uniref:PhoH-like family protein n=1 Tax=Clostridium argentinense CDC 2741 TaxID=1418104 RepID=A0A0C1U4Q6_9CLOT|nr:helicase [Clostridium argentinense]KIE46628.1 phoH-like family protein [Clostridium argentinense CDC 2741]NFF37856.1 helicase [Clostridium argentinense]NFP49912.1 helicase [Clostridium argentinense]NFP71248.1 helicase [Clostridium argentinense]